MFIPIVRRTVTIRVQEGFRFPFQCGVCHLATAATVVAQGIGSATMAYLAPDENAARSRARQNAYTTATSSFGQSPCPRCGSHSVAQRQALHAWEERVKARKQVRFWILIVGLAFAFLASGGCGALMIVSEGTDADTLGGAVVLAALCFFVCAGITAIVWGVAGPGARPNLLPYIPQNVRFDPPDASQVQGGYRNG